ncbi:hypothetical protein M409DRAFT_27944 [Zasmidium cellare ATCC 36951]|uniref:G domain-containing protein n=1 Tax=Zasmidium cellare ATCC 36951 TaxID=1080233 RepID=A0A6A6C818_ZASCE|nr:uncharacterized protein M409DRAFT_27944 [Zasmidium cellare ATCC 36951]KAF2161546.1 hypothetical protein M409DRAFT_27944 [Zasmidium cellare ATCC 36951]
MTTSSPNKTCVFIGNGAIGKTCLIKAICGEDLKRAMEDYNPTGRSKTHPTTSVKTRDGSTVTLELRDTPGQDFDHFEKNSPSYVDVEEEISRACAAADLALVCFSITDPVSFGHVRTKWHPRVRHDAAQDVPIILVGLRSNWRNDAGILEMLAKNNKVTTLYDEGRQMFEEIGAVEYVEFAATVPGDADKVVDAVVAALR